MAGYLALLAYILARLKPRQNMARLAKYLAKYPAILIQQVSNNLFILHHTLSKLLEEKMSLCLP